MNVVQIARVDYATKNEGVSDRRRTKSYKRLVRTCGRDDPSLMQASPPIPSLDRRTWGAVPVITEIPILRGAMDEEPGKRCSLATRTIKISGCNFNAPVCGRVDRIKPNVPRDGRGDRRELRSVGGGGPPGQTDVFI